MSQAIVTRYVGSTNTRQAKITARAAAGRVHIPYDYSKSVDGNHKIAALTLARKYQWSGEWVMGKLINGDFVFVNNYMGTAFSLGQ